MASVGRGRGTGRDVKFRLEVTGRQLEVRKLWGWSQGVVQTWIMLYHLKRWNEKLVISSG